MALSAPRDTRTLGVGDSKAVLSELALKQKANTVIYGGALVALDATGYLVPGATATTLIAAGVADPSPDVPSSDSTGKADGAVVCRVQQGVFNFANSANSDLIGQTEIGKRCYIVDDQTVAKLSTARSVAGVVIAVDADGVWVAVGLQFYGLMTT